MAEVRQVGQDREVGNVTVDGALLHGDPVAQRSNSEKMRRGQIGDQTLNQGFAASGTSGKINSMNESATSDGHHTELPLVEVLCDLGFRCVESQNSICLTGTRDGRLPNWVSVSTEVKDYETKRGRMITTYFSCLEPDFRIPALAEELQRSSPLRDAMWVGVPSSEDQSALIAFGVVADAEASPSDLRELITTLAHESLDASVAIFKARGSTIRKAAVTIPA
jgi:hypothetical protein